MLFETRQIDWATKVCLGQVLKYFLRYNRVHCTRS